MTADISVRMERRQRNRAIAQAVLKGATVAVTARDWKLSTARCYELVQEVCRRSDPELYRSLQPLDGSRVRIRVLREYMDPFIEAMNDDSELMPDSSIRRIRELPTMTLNALVQEGIRTVQDLCQCAPEELRRIPVIGETGLRRIRDALRCRAKP